MIKVAVVIVSGKYATAQLLSDFRYIEMSCHSVTKYRNYSVGMRPIKLAKLWS